MDLLINLCYIAASILFIFGIKMLGSPDTARRGNQVSAVGMLLAVIVTLFAQGLDYQLPDWVVIPGGNLGNVSALVAGTLHERHLMHVCSSLQARLRSFASISKIRSAPFQSFSDIGRFGNE